MSLDQAIKAVEEGMSTRLAAKHFKVPRSTIQDRMSGSSSGKLGRPPVLSELEEKIVAERVKVSDPYS